MTIQTRFFSLPLDADFEGPLTWFFKVRGTAEGEYRFFTGISLRASIITTPSANIFKKELDINLSPSPNGLHSHLPNPLIPLPYLTITLLCMCGFFRAYVLSSKVIKIK